MYNKYSNRLDEVTKRIFECDKDNYFLSEECEAHELLRDKWNDNWRDLLKRFRGDEQDKF